MARRSKTSFQKRNREKKKADKAAQKRDARAQRAEEPRPGEPPVATNEDLADYGFAPDEPGESSDDDSDRSA